MTSGEETLPTQLRLAGGSGFEALLERMISADGARTVLTVRDQTGAELFERDFGDMSPAVAWSPDGRTLAFVSRSDDGRPQVHLAGFGDGSVSSRQLTKLPNGVSAGHLDWAPDGASLLFTAPTRNPRLPHQPYRVSRRVWRYEGLGVIEDHLADACSVTTDGEVTWLGFSATGIVARPCWSPDGRSISYLVSFEDPDSEIPCPTLRVWSVADGSHREVLDANWGWIEQTQWAPDSSTLIVAGAAITDGYGAYAVQKSLWVVGDGAARDLTSWLPGGVAARMQADTGIWWGGSCANMRFLPDGRTLLFTAEAAGRTYVSAVDIVSGDHVDRVAYSDMASYALLDVAGPDDVHAQAGLVLLETAIDIRPRVIRIPHGDKPVVVRPGHRTDDGQIRHYQITSPDGGMVDAWMVVPETGTAPYPTVLKIHGGPYGSVGEVYGADVMELAGRGIAVVFHNFRGSYGYGTESAARITSNWGVNGEIDHHAVLDHLVSLGVADPVRLGVMGHSHGAFATCWLVGRSRRFAAGVAEDPVTNIYDKLLMSDIGPWLCETEWNLKPDDSPDAFLEMSPITYARNCTTPLLLIQGERDVRCPPVQSEQMYTALRETGCTVEMLRLPASDHMTSSFGSYGYRAARMAALAEWFEEYLCPSE
ncbi:MAG TPA: prolyl oligopeptidase family serine peptidase [Trebonia sp.]|jgi:dipeptidyl aminopeptidase/acylaminoacyl peptidase|nr:prolyl oligopeptidase family serine peptidase [Trebonia sp.]